MDKLVIVRLFLVVATAHSWPIHRLDINNAFLHGFLDEEVYMLPPEGYPTTVPSHFVSCVGLYMVLSRPLANGMLSSPPRYWFLVFDSPLLIRAFFYNILAILSWLYWCM